MGPPVTRSTLSAAPGSRSRRAVVVHGEDRVRRGGARLERCGTGIRSGSQGRPRRRAGQWGMPGTLSATLQRIQRAIDFVEAHLFEDLPLDVIAEQGGCSPWHFHRLFGALTGETPASYVWKRRLSEICRRLVETRHTLVDVALDCGFD